MYVPEPKKLKSGSWFIQLRLNGVSVPVTASSKAECTTQARMIKAEYLAGKRQYDGSATDKTLRQGVDAYIKARENSLSPATIRGYRIIQKNRFQAYMDKPMKSLKNWQAIYDSERDRLSAKTLHNSIAFLKSVYEDQTGRKVPELDKLQVIPKERGFFDADQINVFLEAVKGRKCELPALLALSSLRCSEILALTWDKVDLEHGRILVAGAVVPDENNVYVAKETNKTKSSRRYVPIFISQLSDALQSVENRIGSVTAYKTESGLLRAINSVCAGAGLPAVGVHGLRHSFASLCVHLGIPEETAMSIGGWSDFTTMRKIYTHISQRDRQDHTDLLKNFYSNNANEYANELEKA